MPGYAAASPATIRLLFAPLPIFSQATSLTTWRSCVSDTCKLSRVLILTARTRGQPRKPESSKTDECSFRFQLPVLRVLMSSWRSPRLGGFHLLTGTLFVCSYCARKSRIKRRSFSSLIRVKSFVPSVLIVSARSGFDLCREIDSFGVC